MPRLQRQFWSILKAAGGRLAGAAAVCRIGASDEAKHLAELAAAVAAAAVLLRRRLQERP